MNLGRYGKYVRHILSVGVGAAAAWANDRWGLQLDAEFQAAIVVVVYAVLEKALKRFGWLDPEGAADREALKVAAATAADPFFGVRTSKRW